MSALLLLIPICSFLHYDWSGDCNIYCFHFFRSYSIPFDSTDVIIAASTTFVMLVFGTIANVMIIVIVLTSEKLKSVENFFFTI